MSRLYICVSISVYISLSTYDLDSSLLVTLWPHSVEGSARRTDKQPCALQLERDEGQRGRGRDRGLLRSWEM